MHELFLVVNEDDEASSGGRNARSARRRTPGGLSLKGGSTCGPEMPVL